MVLSDWNVKKDIFLLHKFFQLKTTSLYFTNTLLFQKIFWFLSARYRELHARETFKLESYDESQVNIFLMMN